MISPNSLSERVNALRALHEMMVAMTHMFTLGWVSLMIVAVLRQLGPVAFGLKLRHPALVETAVIIWVLALIALIIGFENRRDNSWRS